MAVSSSVVEAYAGRRVLLTGASSVVGHALAGILAGSQAEVWAVSRGELVTAGAVHTLVADLSLPGAFARIYDSAKPHITFHLASSGADSGEANVALSERMNHHLAAEVAEVVAEKGPARWPGLSLIRTGCAAEYGTLDGVVREDSPAHPAKSFGLSMLAGTWAVSRAIQRSSALIGRATTARLFSVYGPGGASGSLLPRLIDAARTGEKLKLGRSDERFDFIYAEDAAEGLLRLGACHSAVPPLMHLATGQLTSVREFAETAARVLALRSGQIEFGPLPAPADDLPHGPVDISRLTRQLGWRPRVTVAEGIRETARLAGITQTAAN